MLAELQISDGTTTIDLLDSKGGTILLRDMTLQARQVKSSSIIHDSPFENDKILLSRPTDSPIITLELVIRSETPDGYAYKWQQFSKLLEKATRYWTSSVGTIVPVYFISRAIDETSRRYALIRNISGLGQLSNFYHQPFVQPADRLGSVTISFEVSDWQDVVPRTNSILPVSNYPYATTGLGNDVIITNEENRFFAKVTSHAKAKGLSHIYHTPDGGGTWTSNYLTQTLPFSLPASALTNAALYFGVSTANADASPFSSIVLHLSREMIPGASYSSAWEYYNGSSWAAISTVTDESFALQEIGFTGDDDGSTIGCATIDFNHPTDWTTANLLTLFGGTAPNITAWWVRLRYTTAPFAPSQSPTFDYRHPYTVSYPFVKINGSDLKGDLASLLSVELVGHGTGLEPRILWVSTRTNDRGDKFSPYLNCSTIFAATDVTFQTVAGSGYTVSMISDGLHPNSLSITGETFVFNPNADVTEYTTIAQWTIDQDVVSQYQGRFRAFLRLRGYNSSLLEPGHVFVKLNSLYYDANPVTYSHDTIATTLLHHLVDLGTFVIPGEASIVELVINLQAKWRDVGQQTEFHDLILMPADEFIGGFYASNPDQGLVGQADATTSNYLDIDTASFPKNQLKAYYKSSSGLIKGIWQTAASGEFSVPAGEDVKLFFLLDSYDETKTPSFDSYYALPYTTAGVVVQAVKRYSHLRGSE